MSWKYFETNVAFIRSLIFRYDAHMTNNSGGSGKTVDIVKNVVLIGWMSRFRDRSNQRSKTRRKEEELGGRRRVEIPWGQRIVMPDPGCGQSIDLVESKTVT